MAKTVPVNTFALGPKKEKVFQPFVLSLKKNKINLTFFFFFNELTMLVGLLELC